MRIIATLILAIAFPLAACTGSSDSGAATPSSPSPSTRPAMDSQPSAPQPAVASLERVVRKGMAYADFRNEVIALGWTPVVDPECKANVVGGDHLAVCATQPPPASCQACDALPELSSYSGDAKSLSVFRNASQGLRMQVVGLGELADWNVPGEDSGLQVLEWEITPE